MTPLAAAAQPHGESPRIGVLSPATPDIAAQSTTVLGGFRQGLRELGYVEGQNLFMEYRFAEWQSDRLLALAAELVQLKPDLIFTHTTAAVLAAKQATTTIPIVVGAAGDLVELGIVASLARPSGNLTGLIIRDGELAGQRLEKLKETVSTLSYVAVLQQPRDQDRIPANLEAAARVLGVRLQRVEAATPEAFDAALANVAHSGAEALMIMDASMFNAHRQQLFTRVATHRLPTVCGARSYAEAGCLMAYAPILSEMGRRAAIFADKILKGTKPADIPVELPHKLHLALNLKTAQALGITFPPTLLVLADELIK